jgi:hypothetical protein
MDASFDVDAYERSLKEARKAKKPAPANPFGPASQAALPALASQESVPDNPFLTIGRLKKKRSDAKTTDVESNKYSLLLIVINT